MPFRPETVSVGAQIVKPRINFLEVEMSVRVGDAGLRASSLRRFESYARVGDGRTVEAQHGARNRAIVFFRRSGGRAAGPKEYEEGEHGGSLYNQGDFQSVSHGTWEQSLHMILRRLGARTR